MRDLRKRLDLCSLNTATLGHALPIDELIELVARAGFGGIAPWRIEVEPVGALKVARQIRDAGLSVSGYCRSGYMPAPTREEFETRLADNCRAIDAAAALDAECFILVVGSLPEGSRDLDLARSQVGEAVGRLLDHAQAAGVRLALEPLHPMYAGDRSCLNTMRQALDLAGKIEGEVQRPWLGVAVDVYHVWWDPEVTDGIARAGKEGRLFAYHVSDWLVPTADVLMDRGMMGDGVVDLPAFRKAMENAGFRGQIEVEILSHKWRRYSVEKILAICADRLQRIC